MIYHPIPRTSLSVSALCYGFGGHGTSATGADSDRLYNAFREVGGNFFDTAHCYSFWVPGGMGISERTLGSAIRRFGGREEIVVGTKGGHPQVLPGYPRPDYYLAPEVIASDVQESLDRLGLDAIDLYYLHRDDVRIPVEEIIDALNQEVRAGRIRFLGASNWSTERIAGANAYALAHGLQGFVCSQPQFNLAEPNRPFADPTMQFLTVADRQWYTSTGMPVSSYSSTACGYFATHGQSASGSYGNPTSQARLGRAEQLAAEIGCTPNQVALAWLMRQPFPVIPIIGTTNLEHLRDALAAVALELSGEQVEWLEGREQNGHSTN